MPERIVKYTRVTLPLDSPEEAIEYSLSFQSVRNILLDTSNSAFRNYGCAWKANSWRIDGQGYIVNWLKGIECDNYLVPLQLSFEGTLLTDSVRLHWGNCK